MAAASRGTAPEDVSAVIVNYNTRSFLVGCVASLRDQGVAEVVVVDNGSTDGSQAALAAADPAARWLAAGGNIGYGRAANLGAHGCPGRNLLICNPDIVPGPGVVARLSRALDADARLGIVGPRLVNADGSLYPSARSFPSLVDAIGHGALGLVWPRNAFSRRYQLLDWDHSEPRKVDWVSGAFFLVRREAWDALGGFDPSYFMYMEDVDLCWRAGRAGWHVGYQPEAEVVHIQGVSADRHPYRMITAHHRSLWRFARRTTAGRRRLLLPVVAFGLAGRVVFACAIRATAGLLPSAPGRQARPQKRRSRRVA
jgi:N-acetylglucosaminyl-diphospho-decaprenol L-rhamnosyltransferase